jgi:hypothetical protein
VTGSIDWDSLAAQATANFLATGQWFTDITPAIPDRVDWDALAAEVQRNFAQTGAWFLGESGATPPPPGPPLPAATIEGTDGPDILAESFDRDVLLGRAGADTFKFGFVTSFPLSFGGFIGGMAGTDVGPELRDIILDFVQGEDVIDLSTINLVEGGINQGPSDPVYDFIGTAPFTAQPVPLVRYEVVGDRTIIQLDGAISRSEPPSGGGTGGFGPFANGEVDAEIELVGAVALAAGDFIL